MDFLEFVKKEEKKIKEEIEDLELIKIIIPEIKAEKVFKRKIDRVIHCEGTLEDFSKLELNFCDYYITKNGCVEYSALPKSDNSIKINPIRVYFSEFNKKQEARIQTKIKINKEIYDLWFKLTENVLGKIEYNFLPSGSGRGLSDKKDRERYVGRLSEIEGFSSIVYAKVDSKSVSSIDVYFETEETINLLEYKEN